MMRLFAGEGAFDCRSGQVRATLDQRFPKGQELGARSGIPEAARSNYYFAFYSLRAKLTKNNVTANTSRSSPRV